VTYRLLTRYTRDDFNTLAEAQWMLRHLAWREVDGAWLGEQRGRIEASIYGIDDEEDDMTTYINPETTTDLMDRAWPIARAYCRATWAIGGTWSPPRRRRPLAWTPTTWPSRSGSPCGCT